MKVGIRDIAREAGVAVSTVSHVLNGTASISREVRDRVLTVARNLGYLDQRRAKATIATMERVVLALTRPLVAAADTDMRQLLIGAGLRHECDRRSVTSVVSISPGPDIDVSKVVEAYNGENAHGIVVIGSGGLIDLGDLARTGLPIVVMNAEERFRRADSVVPAHGFAAAAAVRHLSDRGHSRVLLLTTPGNEDFARRRAGFAEGLYATGLAAVESVTAADNSAAAAAAALGERLASAPGLDGATAIAALSDPLAEGAVAALVAAGMRVPGDVSVIGCDGASRHVPPLTTITLHYERLAASALSLMESRLMVPAAYKSCIHVEMGTEVVPGSTVGPPPRPGRKGPAKAGLRGRRVLERGGLHARPLPGRSG